MTRSITVEIPRDYWLSMNRQIRSHGYRQRIIEALHGRAVSSAMRQGLAAIDGPCDAVWTIHYPRSTGRADPENAAPTCKALMDALVPRWLADDSSNEVRRRTYVRGPNLDRPGSHVVVLELIPDRPGEVR